MSTAWAELASAQAGETMSASPDYRGVEEVVVTARKRTESIQETPIAISVFSDVELDKRSLSNLSEVGAFVPNLTMNVGPGSSGGGNNIQIYIRGIGQSDFLFTTDPGIGIYIDGVYHPRTLGGVLDLLDLESVEILRGPQGTVFGKNTIGGAIVLNSKKPTGELGGYSEVTFGEYDRLDLRAGLDFPLTENLAGKISISSKNRDGYGQRLDFNSGEAVESTGDEDVISGRAALLWHASENVTIDLVGDYVREREKAIPVVLLFNDDDGTFGGLGGLYNALVGAPNGLLWNSQFITDDPFTSFATGPNRNILDAFGLALTANWDLTDSLSLKSTTAYREMDAEFTDDSDASPIQYTQTENVQDQHQFSQEIQFNGTSFDGRLDWVTGLFYFEEFGRDVNEIRLLSGLYNALEALPGPLDGSPLNAPTAPGGPGNPINILLDLDLDAFNEIDITSYAAFAQGAYSISERLRLTAGLRYSYEEKDYTLDHRRVNADVPTVSLRTESDDWDSFTPMASVDYRISDESLAYFSVARGFKSGGFNGRPILESQVEAFDPEEVTSFELGLKSDLLDKRVRLNIAAFFSDYTDLQLGGISDDGNGNLVLRIQNAGKAEIKGLELEFQARPTDEFDVVASLGYTDFQIKSLDPGVVDLTLDSKQIKTPEWNATLGVQRDFSVSGSSTLSIRGDWTYQSSTFQEAQNRPQAKADAYDVLNVRVTYENYERGWEIAGFVTNVTDEKYLANAFQTLSSFGYVSGSYGRPREWGVTLKKRF